MGRPPGPPRFPTPTLSGLAPLGTVAVIVVSEATVELVALTPLKVTAVAPVKFVPLIVTLVMTGGPFVRAKLGIGRAGGGGACTVNALALVAVPPGVVTLIG